MVIDGQIEDVMMSDGILVFVIMFGMAGLTSILGCTLDRVSDPVPHLAENSLVQFFGIFGDTSVCGDPLIFVESLIIDVAMDSGSLQLLFGGIHGHSAFAGRTVPSPISSITTVGDRVSGGFFIDHESDDEGQAIFPDEEDTFFLP
ncbi:hypothetical protein EDD17DRAFT_1504418 [Pisolithus thermaeus]|nr:hypothetical protein EV401DRAFT_1890778 [Pisolithus croceorrhizus]KAI6167251.1 hypothetical protein EDD17DRAFT_1504418 [Pisolithus thermaeus]